MYPYQLASQKPADLDIHFFLKMAYLGSVGQGFTMVPSNFCHGTDH